jgi:hypothetical protein
MMKRTWKKTLQRRTTRMPPRERTREKVPRPQN